jgi:VCBS repeat-containing protein
MKPPLNEIILNSFNSHVNIKEGTFSNEEGYTLYLKKNGQYIYYLDHPRVLNKRYILSEGNWIKDTGTIKLMDKTFNYELKISIEDSNNLTSKFPCFNNRILLKNYK